MPVLGRKQDARQIAEQLDWLGRWAWLQLVQGEGDWQPPLLILQGGRMGFGKRSNPLPSFGPAYLVARKGSGRTPSAVLTIVPLLRRRFSQSCGTESCVRSGTPLKLRFGN